MKDMNVCIFVKDLLSKRGYKTAALSLPTTQDIMEDALY